ncbi:MAG: N-acetylmuramoyl-L-alanine amidase [Paracoccaceae bacterium]
MPATGTPLSTAGLAATDPVSPLWHPSPNFGERRGGAEPDIVVLHYTAMRSAEAARAVLCDPAKEVSAHYLIDEAGSVLQLVEEAQRAWHAGAGRWGEVCDVNSRSIGIELSNCGGSPFAARQMDALEDLLGGILDRWDIPAHRVIGHSDMAPGRKIDPGARFDWRRLAQRGLSVWPDAGGVPGTAPPDPDRFRADLVAFGYSPEIDFETLLDAFRLRFRPGTRGAPFNSADQKIAAALASLGVGPV